MIAEEMYLNSAEINMISYCGLVHDIGKVIISEHILNKPGRLDSDEWIKMKTHCEKGYKILSSTSKFSELAESILYHHERWDGKGYPQGIQGKAIPLPARIIAIADAYDAMTDDRPYKEIISKEKAIEEVHNNAGAQFDPEIAKVFIEHVSKNL